VAIHLQCPRTGETEVLKITITNTVKEERWTLQGRVASPWVGELKASWKAAHGTAPARRCIVNLDDVTFIDKAGERMLRSMSKQGARFVAGDVYVQHVLDRVCGKSS
jgi:hypothetical protein